ncbi:AAA family ATPase, partial [Salmonella enterica]|uniref:AAA family ATPase n=1 Tax=Salmonella enterica TaxID=28901 RepID=UPI003CE6E28C
APKNLQAAFDVAKNNDCVLFFDEADSFLGKRITNVVQGADQALNSLRSQMLILLEEFKGIVIFATNLVTNFDTAFESRILKH